MKNVSYSVLFMRDDADVKTFRVSPRRLKLLLWIFGGLGVVMLIGFLLGVRAFVGYRAVSAERRDLEMKLAEAQVDLERLGNLEKIQGGPAAKKDAPPGAPEKHASAPARAFTKIDSGSLAVDNFRAQLNGGNVSVSFDLNNRGTGSSAGDIRLLLLKNDGSLTELEAPSSSDLTYQIQRFKRISASAKAPEGLNRREALGLRVEIKNSDGEVTLGETYALGN